MASRQSTGLVCPSATETHCSGAVRVFLVPPTGLMLPLAWERKNKHGGVCVERDHTTQFQGHGRARGASPQASATTRQRCGPLHPNPARLSQDLQANPVNLPRSSPCLLPLPQQHRRGGREGLPSGRCSPAEPLTPGPDRPEESGDPAHCSSVWDKLAFSSLKLCWDKCFGVPVSSSPAPWRLPASGW